MKNFNQYITEKIKLSKDRFETKYNGFEYVDLGLPSGTLWAKCNVGAKTETEYGDYFAWGETKPKKEYTWENYKFGVGYNLKKYNDKDKLIELELEDDTAHVNMGSAWRIPTKEQFEELFKLDKQFIKKYNVSDEDIAAFLVYCAQKFGARQIKNKPCVSQKRIRSAYFLNTFLTIVRSGLHGNSSTREHENVRFG
jgi:hypothetical protein